MGTASKGEVGGRGARGWHGRDSCRAAESIWLHRMEFILTKQKEFVFKVLTGQQNRAEEADSELSIQEKVFKSPCRTGPPSKLLLVCTQKTKEPHCHGHVQEATVLLPAP